MSLEDNSARLWDTKTGACLRVYDEHSDFVMWAMVPATLATKDYKDQRRKIKATWHEQLPIIH